MNIDLNEIGAFGNLELLARQMVEGFITGLHKSPYHGFSVEFAEHRLYNAGESTRHIDWKVFARTDKLFTKRYEEETNLRCAIVLDRSSSMYYPQPGYHKMKFSTLAAASLVYLLQKQRDAVGLFAFSDKVDVQTQIKSTPRHAHSLLLQLGQLMQQEATAVPTDIAKVLHEVAGQIHKRSLVVIFSDMLQRADEQQEIFAALQHLKHNKHEVLVFHVADYATEVNFEFEDRPYEFIDLETQEKLKLKPYQVKQVYQEKMAEFRKNLQLKCGQFKIDLIEADVQQGFDKVLYAYLIKRAKMA